MWMTPSIWKVKDKDLGDAVPKPLQGHHALDLIRKSCRFYKKSL